eukprot:10917683-Heterocapsa_arctica.AAC.1
MVTHMAYMVQDEQMASLVYLALTGGAKDIIMQDIEIEDLKENYAILNIFKILDKEFLKPAHEQADVAFGRFEQTRRRTSQPMD